MKHYFIINPVSGKNIEFDVVKDYILPACEKTGVDYEIYETKAHGDGTRFVKEKAAEANGEPVRFYSVGGDGTLYEVLNGAIGFPNAEITVVPKGSGNDYIRLYGDKELFRNVEGLINGTPIKVDGLKITDAEKTEYAINQASMGFDAEACAKQAAMKKIPGAIGHATYLLAGLYCMITKVNNHYQCIIDGKEMKGPFVFTVACVSRWYGSGIKVAPFANPQDGLLDCVVFRRVTSWPVVFKIGMNDWQVKGTHYKRSYCEYIRGKKMELHSKKPVQINVDGECRATTDVTFEIVPGAFNFVIPEKSTFFDDVKSGKISFEPDLGPAHKEPLHTILNTLKPFDLIVNKGIGKLVQK